MRMERNAIVEQVVPLVFSSCVCLPTTHSYVNLRSTLIANVVLQTFPPHDFSDSSVKYLGREGRRGSTRLFRLTGFV